MVGGGERVRMMREARAYVKMKKNARVYISYPSCARCTNVGFM